ncbi:MAG: hypothetical protein L3J08_06775 [Flavobacteriaceae bacterium]|nr:hypothetical protein [Flavobacteriaceae bacterium]
MIKTLTIVISFLALNSFGQPTLLESDGLVVYPFNIDSTDPNELSYLDSIIQPYSIFALAEYHHSETTLKEEKKFIAYLAKIKGLDKIVIERSYAYGYWINEYLDTGDTLLLKIVTDKFWTFDYYHKKDVRYVNYYEFYKWLYNFKIQENLSFDVVGIDLDQLRHGTLSLWSIQHFIDKYALANYFPLSYSVLSELCRKQEPKYSELRKWNKTFQKELTDSSVEVKNSLKYDSTNFYKLIRGFESVLYSGKNMDSYYRENNMLSNFIEEVDSTDIVYAQFGHPHLALIEGDRYRGIKNFGGGFMSHVVKNEKYKSKVLSIYLLCKGCKSAGYTTSHPGIFTQEEYDKIFRALDGESALIDFRNAKNGFSNIHKYFQLSIFLNDSN